MASFTSHQSGDWSIPTTWGGSGVPGSGDTVTVTAGTTVTVSTPQSALSITVGGNNGLLVVNAQLDLYLTTGTALLLNTGYNTTSPTLLELGPGGSIVGHPTTGNTTAIQIGGGSYNACAWQAIGTGWGSGQFCEISNAGAGVFQITNAGTNCGSFTGAYVKFNGLGSSSAASISAGGFYNSATGPGLLFDHARFIDCGQAQLGCNPSGAFRFNDVQFSGSLDPTYSANLTVSAPGTGIERTHDSVTYDKTLESSTDGMAYTNTVFGGDFTRPSAGLTMTMDHCAILKPNGNVSVCDGDVSNCYVCVINSGQDNAHYMTCGNPTTWNVTSCVFDGPLNAPTSDQGDCISATGGSTLTARYNIAVPIQSGAYAGYACGDMIPSAGTSTTTITAEHNTIVGQLGEYAAFYYGENYSKVGIYAYVRSNIVAVPTGSSDHTFIFGEFGGSSQVDACYAANITNNGGYGLATGTSYGYNAAFSTGTPGANDVYQNPSFVDPTRNLPNWWLSLGNTTTGTVLGDIQAAAAALNANPSLVASSLLPWVRAGYAPTNSAFKAASYSGDTSTTDAAGNAWPGSGPGIGAMGYVSAGPPPFDVTTPSATVAGPHEIDLSWDVATGGTSPYTYQLQRAPDVSGSAGGYTNVGSGGSALSYADTQLDPGVTYYYQVVVTDSTSPTPNVATSSATSATTTLPDIPNYALWWSRMVSFLPVFNAMMTAETDAEFKASLSDPLINHDGIYGAAQALAYYRPGNADLETYLANSLRLYRDDYVVFSGSAAGYYLFPEGLGLDYTANGDAASGTALVTLRNNGAYVSQPETTGEMADVGLSRETAYSILTQIIADQLGLVSWNQTQVEQLVDDALNHIAEWLGDPSIWLHGLNPATTFQQPFMMGITGIALGKYLDYIEGSKSSTDSRIVPALASLAVRMRERWWRPTTQDFIWPIYPDGTDHNPTTDNTVLNLESTNFFGWLYHRTGSNYFKTAGDEAFGGGIATTQIYFPKQWNQQYRWSFLYVGWREATPGSASNFYVLDPPFFQNGMAGEPSGTFLVVPLRPITGTFTPSDGGAGGSFSPPILKFVNSATPTGFTYSPAGAGTVTISTTNTAGLTDPAPIHYQASPRPPKTKVRYLPRRPIRPR